MEAVHEDVVDVLMIVQDTIFEIHPTAGNRTATGTLLNSVSPNLVMVANQGPRLFESLFFRWRGP